MVASLVVQRITHPSEAVEWLLLVVRFWVGSPLEPMEQDLLDPAMQAPMVTLMFMLVVIPLSVVRILQRSMKRQEEMCLVLVVEDRTKKAV